MTDKELLELAARAAGYECGYINDVLRIRQTGQVGTCGTYDCATHNWFPWNPLTDDGDALRLAVKLGLRTYYFLPNGEDGIGKNYTGVNRTTVEYHHKSDPYAATRRAIVRAAAEIGRGAT